MQSSSLSQTYHNEPAPTACAPIGITCCAVVLIISSLLGLLALFQMARPFAERAAAGLRMANLPPELAVSIGVLGGQVAQLSRILLPFFIAVIIISGLLLWQRFPRYSVFYWIAVVFFGVAAYYFFLAHSQVNSQALSFEARQVSSQTVIVVRALNKIYMALAVANLLVLAFLLAHCRSYLDMRLWRRGKEYSGAA